MRRLLSWLKHHRLSLATVIAVSVGTAILDLLPPWIIRYTVDRIVRHGAEFSFVPVAAALMGLAMVHGAADFVRLYLTARLGQRVVYRIRTELFAHLSRLSFSFYDAASTGDLVTRATADVDTLSQFFGRSAVIIVTNLLFIVGILVVLLIWNPLLALVYLAMIPFIAAGMYVYARSVRPAMGRVRRQLSALTGRLETTLSGILVVKVFGREPFEEELFERANAAYRHASVQTIRITALWMPVAEVVMGLGTALVLLAGGYGVIQGDVTIGTLIAFTLYIGMLLRPIRQTGMMLSATMQALAAAERVFEIFDTQPEVGDRPGAVPLTDPKGAIAFEDVLFGYEEGAPAVHDISFHVEAGETVALVGPSGAGKSTLVHLLARFYEPQAGRILIDGVDTREITIESLRVAIGIAMQNAFVFDATIGENIAYADPSASPGDVEAVARMVALHDFISGLPDGYDTPVGERGAELSGGQRQRLALARVLLRDPPVLLLDEPTSSQDAATERAMDASLEAARRDRTTIVIAHRLWTVHHADRIVVLEAGRLVDQGVGSPGESAHESLMRAGGLYRRLYDLQFRGESSSKGGG